MMVGFMFVMGSQVLFRVVIKGNLTTRTAEILGLSFVFRFSSSGFGINIHATHRVFCHFYLLMLKIQDYPKQEATPG